MKRTSCAPDQNDALGRVEEAGEKTENSSGPQFATVFGTTVNNFYNPKVIDDANLNAWVTDASGQRTEVTHNYYDAPNAAIASALPNNFTQENLRKRVSCAVYEEIWDNNDATYDHSTHYTYDIHGNVKTLLQDNPNTGVAGQEFKRLDYAYDLISGNVNEVVFQDGQPDMMIHRYEYDADNRITSVETSTDGVFFDNDAKYFYYAHGPLARTELGENQVQGLDYVYTLQGWIKGVNSNTLDTTRDIGQDGNRVTGNPNAYFAKDVFGYTLNYFSGDYQAINATVSQTANNFEADKTGSDLLANREDFFNGNISAMVTTIINPTTGEVLPQGMAYSYDQLNRLLSAKAFVNLDMQTNTWQSGSTYPNRYLNEFTYDANGNILSQTRYSENGTQIENLTYQYNRNGAGQMLQNRLYHVNETVAANAFTDDIDDQGTFSTGNVNTANNYGYDGEGRLIRDDVEEIAQITWTVTGKVKEVIRTSGSGKKNLKFRYDAMGQRIAKEVYDSQNNWEKTTYYVRDPQGNVMAIYEKKIDAQQLLSYKIAERNIYGSSMLGLVKSNVELIGVSTPSSTSFTLTAGERQYYISNHLQSVSTVVSDLIIAHDWNNDNVVDYYRAEIISAVDFYPFGFAEEGRSFNSNQVRVGFNGKEKDDEINVEGGSYDFGARMYDSRLGRWLSVDGHYVKFCDYSSYNYGLDNPIRIIDTDGNDIIIVGMVNGKKTKVKYTPGACPPEGADQFVQDAFDAYNFKISTGEGANTIALANDSKVKVKVKQTDKHGAWYTSKFGLFKRRGIIRWNNKEGMVATVYDDPNAEDPTQVAHPDDVRTRYSPADILEHETAHAKHDVIDDTWADDAANTQDISNPGYDDLEEEKTINETDNNNGQYRISHGGIATSASTIHDKSGELLLDQPADANGNTTFVDNKVQIVSGPAPGPETAPASGQAPAPEPAPAPAPDNGDD